MNTPRVVVAGGGTAGHIEPALAVAESLRQRGAEVVALGTTKGLETSIVPERGFELRLINPVPVPRKINADLFKLPFRLLATISQTRKILKEFDTDVVIGFGGYVAAPAYIAAKLQKIPFIVHEANARSGMANKLGVRLGGMGLNAVANSGMPGTVVGIPIRSSLSGDNTALERAQQLWGLDPKKKTILITGGSQGARSINAAVAEGIDAVLADPDVQVLHAYGRKNSAPEAQERYVPVAYIDDMAAAYAIADLVIGRSGAMTVAENTAAGVPAIYVPLPHGNGEQGLNAQPLVEEGAAVLVADSEFNGEAFSSLVTKILGDQGTYTTMVTAAKESGTANAAETIADIIYSIVKNHDRNK
ncbi:undecaprenyldiphospho-muramoylpentapeptide beta-N-acetylglucosaminyltransferase [Corynebacterium rouxii]|uniref:UDP-N-acetylglucosamine--N-acetylmuramyl-(pentapeptide) pyrophosphoryl-undecaprenol N-acetylglucosamine transferase n=1 Tax=Corynebacterium rouxii TaxID=2719119 RepID=A0ABU3PNL5_9CORY|nr:undecaprenyldiphospho-muramoylpentapeptide beta-N-acetylglucosaminyltransferase [Corynebacterium rouxii]MDT9409181.1 undecaprenyldiphospho-muramoylpentapeptide beta-N-acetylglucosaminyltransferase [Corynebacterium rouxii]MDT9411414.1 undecaprenyldiphospho-muramoylpentapeptide beta-N-acetylglucosaminyltransferase [Corynebacterium rouxii]